MVEENRLVVIHTHPVQYLAPLYREIQRQGVPVTAIYGSDFSVEGYKDEEFGKSFAWKKDLLSGYDVRFLERRENGGARSVEQASVEGLWEALTDIQPTAIMLSAYYPRFHSLACFISAVYVAKMDAKLLLRAETTDHAEERGEVKKFLRDTALSMLYNRFDHFFYIGERSKKHYQRLGIQDHKMSFSPYSVDVKSFREEEKHKTELSEKTRKEFGIAQDGLNVLFVGKLSPRKGVDLLIDAVAEMDRHRRGRVSLIFVGQGSLAEELRARARDENVDAHFVGFQQQQDLSQFYHTADVLVLPSRRGETWGLVVNEALHHGIPAIVSDQVGCAPDLIKEGFTGEVFESGRPKKLKEEIIKIDEKYKKVPKKRKKIRNFVDKFKIKESAISISEFLNK